MRTKEQNRHIQSVLEKYIASYEATGDKNSLALGVNFLFNSYLITKPYNAHLITKSIENCGCDKHEKSNIVSAVQASYRHLKNHLKKAKGLKTTRVKKFSRVIKKTK